MRKQECLLLCISLFIICLSISSVSEAHVRAIIGAHMVGKHIRDRLGGAGAGAGGHVCTKCQQAEQAAAAGGGQASGSASGEMSGSGSGSGEMSGSGSISGQSSGSAAGSGSGESSGSVSGSGSGETSGSTSGQSSGSVSGSGSASGESSGSIGGSGKSESSGSVSGSGKGESSGQVSGSSSGETSGQASASGESSGSGKSESSGQVSGSGSGESSGSGKSESSGSASGSGSGKIENSGQVSGSGSGESSGSITGSGSTSGGGSASGESSGSASGGGSASGESKGSISGGGSASGSGESSGSASGSATGGGSASGESSGSITGSGSASGGGSASGSASGSGSSTSSSSSFFSPTSAPAPEGSSTVTGGGSASGSTQGSGSIQGGAQGESSAQGGASGSAQGSASGSAQGETQGSAQGSASGSAEGSTQGSAQGSASGSAEGSAQGESSAQGSAEASGSADGHFNVNSNYKGQFNKIYAFGDSFTDTGNADALAGLKSFFGSIITKKLQGQRLSNGKIMIDYLCDSLGIPSLQAYKEASGAGNFSNGANFAVAGSTCLKPDFFSKLKLPTNLMWSQKPLSVLTQVDWFNNYLKSTACRGMDDNACKNHLQGSLFWLGAIGFSDYAKMFGAALSGQSITQISVDHVTKFLKAFLEKGAKFLVVQGLPPAGCCPLQLFLNSVKGRDDMGCSPIINSMIKAHNELLQKKIEEFRAQNTGCTIVYADTWRAFREIITNHKTYNFQEPFKSCCGAGGGLYNFNLHSLCGAQGTSACKDPQNFISWDGIHFTERMNRKLADLLFNKGYCSPSFDDLIKAKMNFKSQMSFGGKMGMKGQAGIGS